MQSEAVVGAIAQGLLWSVMAMGIYITYRVLDFADLTAEGCYTLSASVVGSLVTKQFLNFNSYKALVNWAPALAGLFEFLSKPIAATFAAVFCGALAGVVTGLLHTKLKIPALLSGILTMTGLYSVNLRVMGKPSIVIADKNFESISILRPIQTIEINSAFLNKYFSLFIRDGRISKNGSAWIAGILIIVVVITLLQLFFKTELGYALRATGSNPEMARALGANTNTMKILGLALGNALVALGSALVAQYTDYVGINVGAGTIVFGLSAVIIGEVLVRKKNSVLFGLLGVVLGAVIYRFVIAFALSLGLSTDDLKLLTSALLGVTLATPVIQEKLRNVFPAKKKLSFKQAAEVGYAKSR
jgi:putative ABC transport system permease protein